MTDKTQKALNICIDSLRKCYEHKGILAGRHHFTDFWARDAFFAAMGSLSIGDFEIVSNQVEMFFSFQRNDGMIPYRIMRSQFSVSKYLGMSHKLFTNPKPTYRLRSIGPYVLDGTTLSILFWALLIQKNRINLNLEKKVKKALEFLKTRERYGLLWEGVMTEWNDTAWKHGNLLYSNIIYWKMYKELYSASEKFKLLKVEDLKNKKESIERALRARLWNGQYFNDWNGYFKHDYFYSFGNSLAIAWGLTTDSETDSILSKAKSAVFDFTLESNTPKYPWWRIDIINHLTGTSDYQNQGILWMAPAAAYIMALTKAKKFRNLSMFIERLSNKIIKDGTIFEVYERNGLPVNRLFYKSENPFAWASGLLTAAFNGFKRLEEES
ncbi:hypothetical protein IT417_01910 [bacterium]|nr:hypothetical protein [bacterium]